jgi:hypothetical protein
MFVFDEGSGAVDTHVLTAARHAITLDAGVATGSSSMILEGMHHILIGYDHLAFLVVLILAVLIEGRRHALTARATVRRLLVVVTAFTVAHSVTLGLAATGTVHPPGKVVEALIALSIVIAGLLNLPRERAVPEAALAFAFGLIHGFGFASAFAELGPRGEAFRWLTVAQFNLGVEFGQLVAALPAFLLGFYVMRRVTSGLALARHGSVAAAALGAFWFVQRVLL